MKKSIGMLVALLIAVVILLPCEAEAVATEYKAEWSEEFIWEELSKYSPNDKITAGIMGYFLRESQMRSDAVAGYTVRNLAKDVDDICVDFVETIDAGLEDGSTKDEFIELVNVHYGGFGLGQWSNVTYLEHFYDFVQDKGGSIADAEIQCEFIFESFRVNDELWNALLECNTALQCGRRIGYLYDGTGELGSETIASMADIYYRRFHDEH